MAALSNSKHEHFAQLIAGGETPTKAYTLAGYSENGAHTSAARLLRNAPIAARVAELRKAVAERSVEKAAVDRAWVLSGLKENFERSMQHEPVLDREGKETGEYVYQGNVANRALELIGKELGMFKERVESSGPDGGPIQLSDITPRLSTETLERIQAEMESAKSESDAG